MEGVNLVVTLNVLVRPQTLRPVTSGLQLRGGN